MRDRLFQLFTLALLPAMASLASIPTAQANEELVDRIVAVVDGYPILHSEILDKVTNGPLVALNPYPADQDSQPYEQALQDAVNFELMLQAARELEIDVRDSEVEAEIENYLARQRVTRDIFERELSARGLTFADYREDFRQQIILRRFQGKVITPQVKVTDKDVETYYLKKTGASSEDVKLVLRQILIRVPNGASEEMVDGKSQLAGEAYRKLEEGMAFPEAVKLYSDDAAGRENGGLSAPYNLSQLNEKIRGAVEGLAEGEYSQPVRIGPGFYIFYLEEKQFTGSSQFLAQKDRLLMELRTLELMDLTQRWIQETRQKTKVEIIN